jgi:hypothetical protein
VTTIVGKVSRVELTDRVYVDNEREEIRVDMAHEMTGEVIHARDRAHGGRDRRASVGHDMFNASTVRFTEADRRFEDDDRAAPMARVGRPALDQRHSTTP